MSQEILDQILITLRVNQLKLKRLQESVDRLPEVVAEYDSMRAARANDPVSRFVAALTADIAAAPGSRIYRTYAEIELKARDGGLLALLPSRGEAGAVESKKQKDARLGRFLAQEVCGGSPNGHEHVLPMRPGDPAPRKVRIGHTGRARHKLYFFEFR